MSRPPHLGLRHLALNVRALEAMRQFYVETLGFTVEWEPDPDNVYLTSGSDNLALHRAHAAPGAVADPPSAGGAGALDHLGLLAGKAEDVDAWAAFLEARGVTLDSRPRTHRDGTRSIYFRDPDGNRIQIIWIPHIADR
jgi:catechol 2,3-dioxygenase-like lactoylglutathione lyase family enzyme